MTSSHTTSSHAPTLRCKTCDVCNVHFEGIISPDVDLQLLRCPTAISEKETAIQDEWLQSDEQLLEEQEQKIHFQEAVLQKMYAGRAIVCSRIWKRRSLKGAVRRTPVEILNLIFKLACSEEKYDWRDRPVYPISLFSDDSRNIPGVLSEVCYLWRSVVQNTSDLWTDLCIMVPRTPSEENHLQQILDRSGSRPLKLSVEIGPWMVTRSPPPHVAVLCSALSRAGDLHISFDIVGGLDLTGVTYPHLKRVRLHAHSAFDMVGRYSYSRPQVQALVQAPQLETFSTNDFNDLGRDEIYPRSTISAFECHGQGSLTQAHLMELVARCPGIRSLNIMLRGSSFRYGPSQQPLLLPRLERLVYNYDTSDRTVFLDTITAPSLTDLTVPADPAGEFTAGLLRFIERSGCRLLSLDCNLPWEFDGKSLESGWPAILTRTPDLKSLRVKMSASRSWNGQDPFEELRSVLKDTTFARALTSLRISASAGGWRDLERQEMEDVARRFLGLAESRSPLDHALAVEPLQVAVLHLDRMHSGWGEVGTIPLTGALESQRQALVNSGMECTVVFPPVSIN
ncbi:hypothetical protein V5O48_014781 [Marasmius crinis-equi]|uniref:F-box domain-containing protein n=1 Tax=Marasmius crinis-equi TaxID=585013 RepID=A0ABR3EWB1_9AGAR